MNVSQGKLGYERGLDLLPVVRGEEGGRRGVGDDHMLRGHKDRKVKSTIQTRKVASK